MKFVVTVREIDSKGLLTQDRAITVYGPYDTREAATMAMDTVISPRTPRGYALGVYPMTEIVSEEQAEVLCDPRLMRKE